MYEGFMVTWSIVTLLSYKAYNFETLLVCRFLLGIVEAPVRHMENIDKIAHG
jgi:predicted MFS family arabinose efflux permease